MNISKNELLGLLGIAILVAIMEFYRHLGIIPPNPIIPATVYLLSLIYLLWVWKDKTEFAKRCFLAVPFALLFTSFFKIIGFELGLSIRMGIVLFFFLVLKRDNWKQHFAITLITAIVLAIVFAYFRYNVINNQMKVYKIYIMGGISWLFIVFYSAYSAAGSTNRPIELRYLLWKSFKFFVVSYIFFVLFMISQSLYRRYRFSPMIPWMISGLLSLIFLLVVYRFNLGFSERSKSKKRIDALNKELLDILNEKKNIN